MTRLRRERLVRLDRLDLGRFDVGPGRRLIPITGFLLTTDAGTRILFDTGFPAAYAQDERSAALADGLDGFGRLLDFTPRQTITGALALHGLAPADIAQVILSHSHIDHVGGLDLFAHARIWLTAAERALPRPLYFGARRPMVWPQTDYRTITRATEVCGGLQLIPTPGHCPGHLSALIRLPQGPAVILAADAINRASEPAEGYPDADDPATAARSGAKLFRLARRHDAQLICGHEPADLTPGALRWP